MGVFGKIAQGLSKTRDSVVREVMGAFGQGVLDDDALAELEERLVACDIGLEAAELIVQGVRDRAYGRYASQDQVLRWLAESTEGLIPDPPPVDRSRRPHTILMVGVNGTGKTTTVAKLARHFKDQGLRVLVAAGDTFRAGAVAQLDVWAQRVGVDIVKHAEGSDAASVAYDGYAAAKSRGSDIYIVDTAGRLHNKAHLMEELRKIVRVLRKHDPALPHESLLVVDGNTGQNAIQQAKGFNGVVDLQGLVVTKLDGTAKGGAIIPIVRELGVPVTWVGVGEGVEDLVPFSKSEYVKGMFAPLA